MTDKVRRDHSDNALDRAVVRHAEAVTAPLPVSSAERLRDLLIEQHGPDLGPVLYQARIDAQAQARRQAMELKSALEVAKQALELREAQCREALVPFERALEEAQAALQRAAEEHAAQALRISADTMPLRRRIAELIRELNRPAPHFEQRSAALNWKPSDAVPKAAQDEGGPRLSAEEAAAAYRREFGPR